MSDDASDDRPRRVAIIGNSGSGKSTLASRLASEHGLAHLDLDTLAWLPTEPPTRVPLDQAATEIAGFLGEHTQWVVEGCYADLVELVLDEVSELVFLDISVAACQEHARRRPWEPHKYPSKEAQDRNLEMLLEWIAAYPEREGAMGRPAHDALFEAFSGRKQRRREASSG